MANAGRDRDKKQNPKDLPKKPDHSAFVFNVEKNLLENGESTVGRPIEKARRAQGRAAFFAAMSEMGESLTLNRGSSAELDLSTNNGVVGRGRGLLIKEMKLQEKEFNLAERRPCVIGRGEFLKELSKQLSSIDSKMYDKSTTRQGHDESHAESVNNAVKSQASVLDYESKCADSLHFLTSNGFSKDISSCGHSNLNMLPAGFDLNRLNTYKDPNHWHIRKNINENPKEQPKKSPNVVGRRETQTLAMKSEMEPEIRRSVHFDKNEIIVQRREKTSTGKSIGGTREVGKKIEQDIELLEDKYSNQNRTGSKTQSNERKSILFDKNEFQVHQREKTSTGNQYLIPEKLLQSFNGETITRDIGQKMENDHNLFAEKYSKQNRNEPKSQWNESKSELFAENESQLQIKHGLLQERTSTGNLILEKKTQSFNGETMTREVRHKMKEDHKLLEAKTSIENRLDVESESNDSSCSRKSSESKFDQIIRHEENLIRKQNVYDWKPKANSIDGKSTDSNKENSCENIIMLQDWLKEISDEYQIKSNIIEPLILAHSKAPVKIIQHVVKDTFDENILFALQHMHMTKLYRIQQYAWPNILRGNSLFLINPIQSGKTWGYLPCVCSLVISQHLKVPPYGTYGPIAVIIVASAMRGEYILRETRRLLHSYRDSKVEMVVPLFGTHTNVGARIQLLRSCGILITTLVHLTRLIEQNKTESLLNKERLELIVIDDIDLMMQQFSDADAFKTMMEKVVGLCNFKKPKSRVQLIVTSREWHKSLLMPIIRKANDPLLLFGDFLEAAVYGKAMLHIRYVKTENKIDVITNFIERENALDGKRRIVVVCNTNDEVNFVEKSLKSGITCFSYQNDADIGMRSFVKDWKSSIMSRILICTDDVLGELEITNAHYLINYSLPTSWTKFKLRFALTANNLPNFMQNPELTTFDRVKSLTLIEEANGSELPNLINFLRRHRIEVDPHILKVSEELKRQREERLTMKGVPMCTYFLELGNCEDMSRCNYRHVLTERDLVPNNDITVPTSGDLVLFILKIYSPTHFAARLLKHRLSNTSKWIELDNAAPLFGMEIQLHYSKSSNCVVHWPLNVNDICIMRHDQQFKRVRIVNVPTIKHKDVVRCVQITVQLLDVGTELLTVSSDGLLSCSERFSSKRPLAIDVRVTGIVPYDNERKWDSKATRSVNAWLITDLKENNTIHAPIDFALRHTIFVQNCVVMEQLPAFGQLQYSVNLKKSLIKNKFGKSCKAQRDALYSMIVDLDKSKRDDNSLQNVTVSSLANDDDEDTDEEWSEAQFENASDEVYVPLKCDERCEQASKGHFEIHNVNKTNKNHIESQTDDNRTQEIWYELPLQQYSQVEIGDENENGAWTSIYMQDTSEESIKKFGKLSVRINSHISDLKAKRSGTDNELNEQEIKLQQHFILKYKKQYLRAKLISIEGDDNLRSYSFFFVDYACFIKITEEELRTDRDLIYVSTREIVEFTPFQAVHCTLVGINLKQNIQTTKVTKDYLYAYAVIKNVFEKSMVNNLNINSYAIILYESENMNEFAESEMLNKKLVEANEADYDPDTKHLLSMDDEINIAETESLQYKNEKCGNELVNFDQFLAIIKKIYHENDAEKDDLPKILNSTKNNNSPEKKIKDNVTSDLKAIQLDPSENGQAENKKTIENNKVEIDKDINKEKQRYNTNLPKLKQRYKRPQVSWYDTTCYLHMNINASEVKNYQLGVKANKFVYTTMDEDIEQECFFLNLAGNVREDNVQHERRGFNICVRLVKLVPMKWTNIISDIDGIELKFPWLKYDLSRVVENLQTLTMPQLTLMTLHGVTGINNNGMQQRGDDGDLSDDDDDEIDQFTTFTEIRNSEDIHDFNAEL